MSVSRTVASLLLCLLSLASRASAQSYFSGVLALPIGTVANQDASSPLTVPTADSAYIDDICIQLGITHSNIGDLKVTLGFTSIQEGTTDMVIFDQPADQTDNLDAASLLSFTRYPTDTNVTTIGIADGEPITGNFFAGNLVNVLGELNAGEWTITVEDEEDPDDFGVLVTFNLFFNDDAGSQCQQSAAPSSAPSAAPSAAPSSSPTEQSPVATPNTWLLVGGLTLAPFLAFLASLLRPKFD